ncbi:MAG UNVERIFIED_CONTAM: hypothetical protein LVR18_09625 [Planctomycetaceae bacterium]
MRNDNAARETRQLRQVKEFVFRTFGATHSRVQPPVRSDSAKNANGERGMSIPGNGPRPRRKRRSRSRSEERYRPIDIDRSPGMIGARRFSGERVSSKTSETPDSPIALKFPVSPQKSDQGEQWMSIPR